MKLVSFKKRGTNETKKGKVCIWAVSSIIIHFIIPFCIALSRVLYKISANFADFSLNLLFFSMPISGIFGVIFAIIALVKIHRNPSLKGERIAIIGLILGMLLIVAVYLVISGQSGNYLW